MEKKQNKGGILIILLLFIININAQLSLGDSGVRFDNSKNDAKYPFMKEWQKAGVQGGIPKRNTLPIKLIVAPTNSKGIQEAINSVNTEGELSVVLLKKGSYTIDRSLNIKSNIILRGETKDEVIFNVTIRAYENSKASALKFNDVRKSGLEDITFEYIPTKSTTIYDDRNKAENRFCGSDCFSNDPDGIKNMYVSFVEIDKRSKNCWIDNCVFKNSGTNPLKISGDYITCRNNFIDACFNKGGGGNGYYDIRGNYGLFVNESVRRIRHFAIQQKAKYNVVTNCNLEVDVNFHNGDEGYNLIENNKISSLQWRSWGAFASGGSKYGHKKPGSNNLIFNNKTRGRSNSERFSGDKVFVFDRYGEPRLLSYSPPKGKTFYPAILTENNTAICGRDVSLTGLAAISNTKTSITVEFDEISGVDFYELRAWKKGDFTGSINETKAISFKSGNSSPLTISDLDINTEYTLVLRGVCEVGKSTKISHINATTSDDYLADGVYYIQNPSGDIRINSPSGSLVNQSDTNGDSAKWMFTKVDTHYLIKNLRNNEYLEVPYKVCNIGDDPRNLNVNLATYSKVLDDHQRWKITKIGEDYFLRPLHCDKAVDRPKNKPILLLWSFDVNNKNQNWRIVSVEQSNRTKSNILKQDFQSDLKIEQDLAYISMNSLGDYLTIHLTKNTSSEITIFNLHGEKVYNNQFNENTIEIKIENLGKKGLYFVKIQQGGYIITKKIVLQ
ncbi:T9SS type A sorting domain-containing protein [Tenacibaculum jejuense]|uniref:Fibronectin type-III domain-containing protein n=1 Tax=Tenacibaculum jejuense TaxID=584609 RepID=A0A238U8R1_9FLAO|nr:T9SS type A sorting domain-containing protein [Tenacibaculum jejuense]SNR15571.1 Protein of unknown function precursor containing a C-terminal secretion signal [Tenacibaculum jejuense]